MASRPTATIVKDDKVLLNRIKRNMKQLVEKPHVAVGWLQEDVARYMAVHEFGAPNKGIPARYPMSAPIRRHRKKIQSDIDSIGNSIVTGSRDVRQGLDTLGIRVAQRIKQSIATEDFPPPLSQKTLRRKKGRGKTMVDHAIAKNAVSWEVRK